MIPDQIQEMNVSILDGDLGDDNGAQIAELIRQTQLPIGIIGLSGGVTPWADVSLHKADFDTKVLRETVDIFVNRQLAQPQEPIQDK